MLANYDTGSQTAMLQVVINPLVDWIWFGFGVIAFGTGIALLPERAYAFAAAKVAGEAVATTGAILLAVLLAGTTLSAQGQHVLIPGTIAPATNPLEQELREEMGCTCGTCAHEPLTKCTCGTAEEMRQQLHAQIEQGKSKDDVLAALVEIYGGQQFLGAPMNKGFARMAWLFPYLAGLGGAAAIGLVAVRWSRQHPGTRDDADAAGPDTPAMEERLDDELRNLD